MSSDTFYVSVRAISGASVELVCKTSTAGGLNDFATTRSFALIAIADCLPWGDEKPLQQAMIAAADGRSPAPTWEEAYHRDHVGKFIASTELLERNNIIDDEKAWWAVYESDGAPRHEFVLRVTMTDPRLLEGLEVGSGGGTTAYDAWYPDPAGPTRDEVAAVTARASHWP